MCGENGKPPPRNLEPLNSDAKALCLLALWAATIVAEPTSNLIISANYL